MRYFHHFLSSGLFLVSQDASFDQIQIKAFFLHFASSLFRWCNQSKSRPATVYQLCINMLTTNED